MSDDSERRDFASEVLRQRRDLIPTPYGSYDAMESSGAVAAPLLAGFALTMAALVLTSPDRFRWPNLVLLLLTVAVICLVMSVQAAQWTRSFRVRPKEVDEWWPEMTTLEFDDQKSELLAHHLSRKMWVGRQRTAYQLGIVGLLAGLAFALVPPNPAPGVAVSNVRWLAVALAFVGFGLEVLWVIAGAIADSENKTRLAGPRAKVQSLARALLGLREMT